MDPELLEACRKFLGNIPANLHYITPQQLYELMQNKPDDIFLLDNRTPEAYRKGHIPGSVNIFLKEVLEEENLSKLDKDKKIIICCWVGHTSSQLLTVLQLLGYDAIGLKYGMGESAIPGEKREGWFDLNLPLHYGDEP